MMNRRHKFALFITLVFTGCALLAGASISQALGLVILGAACSWVFGSEATRQGWLRLRAFPGAVRPWLRFPFILAIAGGIFGVILAWSNFNTFLAVGAMTLWGVLLSSEQLILTNKGIARAGLVITAFLAFFVALLVVAALLRIPGDRMERVGELAGAALIAMLFGRFWLSRALPAARLSVMPSTLASEAVSDVSRHRLFQLAILYVSFVAGTLLLIVFVGLLAFNGFSESVVPLPKSKSSPAYGLVVLFMLLTWWPYAAWRGILMRQPSSSPANLMRHRAVLVSVAALCVVVIAVAATFGLQSGSDREMSAKIEANSKRFGEVARQIGAIKGRPLETTDDYIAAYTEILPLLDQFDESLKMFDSLYAEADDREQRRGPVNIRWFYDTRQRQKVLDANVVELLRNDSILTRKQIAVTQQMATLPETERVDLWNEQFLPLTQEEERLRAELTKLNSSAR